jgi:hypothetical protein
MDGSSAAEQTGVLHTDGTTTRLSIRACRKDAVRSEGYKETKWRWGRFSSSTSVSPANLQSTNFSIITLTYDPGLVQSASSGRSTQSPATQIKEKLIIICY